jgi:hypothetical protein
MLVKVMLICLENFTYLMCFLNIVSTLQYSWGYFVTVLFLGSALSIIKTMDSL